MSDALPTSDALSRRAFLAQSTLAAVSAVLVSACGDGEIGPTATTDNGTTATGTLTVRLADHPALAMVGVPVRVDPGTAQPRALVRTGANSFAAFSMICTHASCLTNVQGSQFVCPCHGSRFAATGAVLAGPSGAPASSIAPLRALAVTVDQGAGTVRIG